MDLDGHSSYSDDDDASDSSNSVTKILQTLMSDRVYAEGDKDIDEDYDMAASQEEEAMETVRFMVDIIYHRI